jgi:hypothetical protein
MSAGNALITAGAPFVVEKLRPSDKLNAPQRLYNANLTLEGAAAREEGFGRAGIVVGGLIAAAVAVKLLK